jgi:hypothetical protein
MMVKAPLPRQFGHFRSPGSEPTQTRTATRRIAATAAVIARVTDPSVPLAGRVSGVIDAERV